MSAKKDGLVNIGGFIALHDEALHNQLGQFTIIYEGFLTYGGMSGRAMGALATGLQEAIEYDYLHDRYTQVKYLGDRLISYGIPIQTPIGGHALYIDAKKMLPHIPQSQYPAQVLGVEAYIEGGVRGVEIGTLLADRDSMQHMDYVAATLANVKARADEIRSGYAITRQAEIMRHFTVELEEA